MQLTEIVITNSLPSGTTFAATLGAQPQAVFIPGKVAAACSLKVGQRVRALLVPNTLQPDKTPWMAARIDVVIDTPRASNEALIVEALNGGCATADELSEDLNLSVPEVERLLSNMVGMGMVFVERLYAVKKEDFTA